MEKQYERRAFLKSLLSLSAFIAGSSLSYNNTKIFKTGKICRTEALAMGSTGKRVKKIAVEEHCFTKEYVDWLYSRTDWKSYPTQESWIKGQNIGEGRIKEMDETGIDMQVLSLSNPDLNPFKTEDAIAMSKIVNDRLSEIVKQYPDRFAAYCCLPFHDPEAAADELERAVTKLGLKGAMIQQIPERKFSDQKYEVIYERLAKLNVPIYFHYIGTGEGFIPDLIKLVNSDLFDKYPNLQFMLGHGGESMPFWLYRGGRGKAKDGQKSFMQKFIEHFYVTTSNQCWNPLLQFLIAVMGADRVLFATDYPYESLKEAVDFIDTAPISDSDREKICHLNAEKLFKL